MVKSSWTDSKLPVIVCIAYDAGVDDGIGLVREYIQGNLYRNTYNRDNQIVQIVHLYTNIILLDLK